MAAKGGMGVTADNAGEVPDGLSALEETRSRRFRPYPEYTDSGVSWLGRIPSHWKVRRSRSTVTGCQNGTWGDEPDGMHDMICVRVADFDRVRLRVRLEDQTLRSIEPRAAQARQLGRGDLLLEKSGGGEKQPVGAVVMYDHGEPAVCSNFVARLSIADGNDPRFLTYLHAALYAARVNTRSIKQSTGIQNLDSTSYLNERVGLPERQEQVMIATFLDHETSKVDELVEKKERLMELLQEKRTALITHAVTRGLDPTFPMKESGIEWIGEIPAHWEVGPVYARYEVALGKMLDAKKVTGEHLGPYIRNVDVQWDTVNTDDLPEMDFSPSERERYGLRGGDLLVCEGGEVGRTALWTIDTGKYFYQKAIHRVRPRSRDEEPRYFFYLMYALAKRGVFVAGGNPNTIDHLTAVQLRHYRIPFAPIVEQRAIAGFLDCETAGIDALVARMREAIGCLREFRTALISAAVTGKIDVREEVQ